jgi:hypothetical protein
LAQRDQCDDGGCVNTAYVERLTRLAQWDGVFLGWSGTFESWSDLQLTITPKTSHKYQIEISGGGSNWTCDGEVTAHAGDADDSRTLTISGDAAAIRAAGTSVLLGDGATAALGAWCGARAPQVSGFYSRIR